MIVINQELDLDNAFTRKETVKSVCWLDSGKPMEFTQAGDRVPVAAEPYCYGQSFVVRITKITV